MFNKIIPRAIRGNKLERIVRRTENGVETSYSVEREGEKYEFPSQKDLFESQKPFSSTKNVLDGFVFNTRISSNHDGFRMYSLEDGIGNSAYVIGKVNDDGCFEITEADSKPTRYGNLLKELAINVEIELKKYPKNNPVSSVRVKVFTPGQYKLASEMGFKRAYRTFGDYVAGLIFDRLCCGIGGSDRKLSVYMKKKL